MVAVMGIIGVVVSEYFVKDHNGVSYLEDGYKTAKYYLVDRNQAALEGAKGAKVLIQADQDRLNAELNK